MDYVSFRITGVSAVGKQLRQNGAKWNPIRGALNGTLV